MLSLECGEELEAVHFGRSLVFARQHSEPPPLGVFPFRMWKPVAITVKRPLKKNTSIGTIIEINNKPFASLEVDILFVILVGVHSQGVDAGLQGLRPVIYFAARSRRWPLH